MSSIVKITGALILISVVWFGVLLKLGLWHLTAAPADGHLSRTFEGWEKYPASHHLFLAQLESDDFAQKKVYVSGTYPFIFTNFLIVAPIHFILRVPYNVAHNFVPYFFVLFVLMILILTTRNELLAIAEQRQLLVWLLLFVSVGIVITDPLPWTSSFNAARDNPHILTAALFCYLSTYVFYGKAPTRALFVVGILLALWTPMMLPAWILAALFLQPTLKLDRKLLLQIFAVLMLGAVNAVVPRLIARLVGVEATGSSISFRSGLDGSTAYLSSIPQAVWAPVDPRHWPTALYFLIVSLIGIALHLQNKDRKQFRPLQQAFFLLIPYATLAIFLPQLTSVHPYTTDLFLFIPATFLLAFWFLQRKFWQELNPKIYVGWFLLACFVLMSNLLTVAQMPRFAVVEGNLNLMAVILVGGSVLAYVGFRFFPRRSAAG